MILGFIVLMSVVYNVASSSTTPGTVEWVWYKTAGAVFLLTAFVVAARREEE